MFLPSRDIEAWLVVYISAIRECLHSVFQPFHLEAEIDVLAYPGTEATWRAAPLPENRTLCRPSRS